MSLFPSLSVSVTFFSLSASHSPLFHTHFTPCQRENYSLCQVSQEIPNKDSNIPYTLCIFPGGSDGRVVCLQCRRPGFNPWVRKIPCRRKWHPTPVLLPGKSHGRRSLVGYSPGGHKESDKTERLLFTQKHAS